MAEIKPRKIMRCPVCFARENDITLMKDEAEYYCIHCSYHGTTEDITAMYADLRKKYQWNQRRVTLDELRKL